MKLRRLISLVHNPGTNSGRSRPSLFGFVLDSRTVVDMGDLRWSTGCERGSRRGWAAARFGARFTQDEGEQDRDGDSQEQRREGRLIVAKIALAAFARTHEHASEDGTEQGGRREVDEIDEAGRGAAVIGAVCFLANGVGAHRGA